MPRAKTVTFRCGACGFASEPDDAAGLHRLDPESAGLVRAGPAEAVEIRLAAIRRMGIAALGIRLPDLDKAVDHGRACPVDHPARSR